MWVYNNSIWLDIFSYKLDSVFVSWILRKWSLTVPTNIPITTSGTVPKILIVKYHNNIHTLCFLANNSERSLHTSECYKLQRGRVKNVKPDLFCLSVRTTCSLGSLWGHAPALNQSEWRKWGKYWVPQLLHKKLVDFVCVCVCVCVFGITRPQRIYTWGTRFEFHWFPALTESFCLSFCPCRGRWEKQSLSGGGGAQQGGEERAEQKCQAQRELAGTVALLASFAAGLLAQNTLKVRRTAAALVLNTRPPVLAQE